MMFPSHPSTLLLLAVVVVAPLCLCQQQQDRQRLRRPFNRPRPIRPPPSEIAGPPRLIRQQEQQAPPFVRQKGFMTLFIFNGCVSAFSSFHILATASSAIICPLAPFASARGPHHHRTPLSTQQCEPAASSSPRLGSAGLWNQGRHAR